MTRAPDTESRDLSASDVPAGQSVAVHARKTVAEACADGLRHAILRGEYAPGSRLPPERELAEALGVNRMTLRAALARLAQEGLLEARQGSGHTVRDFLASGGPALVPAVLEVLAEPGARRAALADLLATRRVLARLVLQRAAEALDRVARRDEAVGALAQAIAAFERRVDEGAGVELLSAADQAIVVALLRLTGSPVLPLFMNPVAGLLGGVDELRAAIYAEPRGNVAGWRAALDWLLAPSRAPVEVIERLLAARDEANLARLAAGTR